MHLKEQKKSPLKRVAAAAVAAVLAMGLVPAAAWAGTTTQAAGDSAQLKDTAAAASPIDVYMTVSNKGTLALARQEISVSDLNEDGTITFDEALQVAHEKYCPAGKDGYATSDGWATKLWGVETMNTSFAKNDVMNTLGLNQEAIAAGDELVASVHKDDVNYSDHYAFFDKKQVTVDSGAAFTLTLKAINVMAYPPVPAAAAAGVQVGTWENGTFSALSGNVTGADGVVSLKFDKPGTYVVSANGTVASENWSGTKVDAPLTAPVCVVTVNRIANTMKVSAKVASVKRSVVKTKNVTISPIKVTKAKGMKSFKVAKWTTAKAKKYIKVNAKNGKVTVKKGTPKGKYKFKVTVTANGNDTYQEKAITKTVTVKVLKK